jgi:four helix bundle protein
MRELRLEDLIVWHLASRLEAEVIGLVQRTSACRDFRFANQLTDAVTDVASDVSEGFHRFSAAEFAQFLRYARASLAETEKRLRTGVLKRHFTETDIAPLIVLAKRLGKALTNFEAYLLRKAQEKKERERRERRKRLT